ncbi:MAG: nitronate monooxygenase [Proteobacteria bacterium]|nr:nitronate monooxygenase [Pseudomonadota bacterium]
MKTRLTDLLGIEHPIVQGAMTWVSFPPLVAAVSNAGGLGILGAAFMSVEELRDSIREVRRLTPKPYGVNFAADNPLIDELLDVITDEQVPVVSYGIGNPRKIIERTRRHGIINLPTAGSLRHAVRAERDGADAVIVQGTEAGGHTGFVSTVVLTPLAAGSLKVPVVAAGGITDGRGLVAALALGAEGVSMGTRFIVTRESPVPRHVKELIIAKSEEDTVVTDNFTGVRCRVIRNEFAENLIKMAENEAPPWEILKAGVGKIRAAYVDGDIKGGSMACGQACGLVNNIPTCRELIDEIIQQAGERLREIQAKAAR